MTVTILEAPAGSPARAAFERLGAVRDAEIDGSPHAATQACLVALDDGRTVARIVARVVPALSLPGEPPTGCLGWFEAVDSGAASDLLFQRAVDWLRAQGAGRVLGPLRGDTWHRYRLNVGPFDEPAFLMEPWNPPFHEELWTRAGFVELERYVSARVDALEPAAVALRPRLESARGAGYTFRPFDLDRAEEELDLLYRLSCEGFRDNFLYTPISREAFLALYRPALPLVQPRLVWIVVGPAGDPAGFLFCLADAGGGVPTLNLKTCAVVPTHRRGGLASALGALAYEHGAALGARRANLCLLRAGNPSQRLDGGAGRVFRNYVLYESGVTA